MCVPPARHSGGRQPGLHAGWHGDEEGQVAHLEEAAVLQAAGGLHDHLVQVQEGRQAALHV